LIVQGIIPPKNQSLTLYALGAIFLAPLRLGVTFFPVFFCVPRDLAGESFLRRVLAYTDL